jgi:hypothetical protein
VESGRSWSAYTQIMEMIIWENLKLIVERTELEIRGLYVRMRITA